MENDQARFFDEATASTYDDLAVPDTDAAVGCLAELARGGPVLELGIGTGRLALPLAAAGLTVDGIDISPAMVERLRAKRGGTDLRVLIGDLADVPLDGRYALVFVAFNTLFNLGSQDHQIRCFRNVAAHLTEDGRFVVEAYVPSFLHRLRGDQHVDVEAITTDEVRLDALRHDPVEQRIEESHVSLSSAGVQLFPVAQRYAWPSELDLMGRIADLRLQHRWGGWRREPFTARSRSHVSVYGR